MHRKLISALISFLFVFAIFIWCNAPVMPAFASGLHRLPGKDSTTWELHSTCLCPATSGDWAMMPDSMDAPDIMVSMMPIPIKRLIICDHGVFFCFSAKADGSYHSWWFAFLPPSKDRYRPYIENAEAGAGYALMTKLDATIMKDKGKYTDMRKGIKDVLGNRYRNGEIIHFDRSYEPPLTLTIRDSIEVEWKGRSVAFRLMPELYYRKSDFISSR